MRRAKPHSLLGKFSFRKVFQVFICEHFFALRTGAKNSYPRRKLRKFTLLKGKSRRNLRRLISLSPKRTFVRKKHILELRGKQKALKKKLKTFSMGRAQKFPSPLFLLKRKNAQWKTKKWEVCRPRPFRQGTATYGSFFRKGQRKSKLIKSGGKDFDKFRSKVSSRGSSSSSTILDLDILTDVRTLSC